VNKTRTARSLLLITVVTVALSCLCAARDIAVIVDRTNGSASLSTSDLTKMLKTAIKTWPDGKKVTVFLSDPSSADMKLVLQKVYGMSADEVKAFAGSHRGDVIVVGSDELVLKAVQTNPGALGVVNVYSINSGVKVLKVDGKLPLESGYLFHGNN
jgi:ABC-type phosphate transport system substrate-binding protein